MNPNASLLDRAGLDKVRVGKLIDRGLEGADDGELFLEYKQSEMLVFDNGRLKQATYDLGKHQFNTVASAAMKILNALEELPGVKNGTTSEGLSILLRLLSPITPHVCHALWRDLGFGEDIMTAPWPEPDSVPEPVAS